MIEIGTLFKEQLGEGEQSFRLNSIYSGENALGEK